MKLTTEMPTEGQFVATWICNDRIWCDTFQWKDGKLLRYDEATDAFFEDVYPVAYGSTHVCYVVQ